MRPQQFTLASVATLFGVSLLSASPASARGGKKGTDEMPASMSQQFQWEDKVVGPKEGLDKDKVAATRERGIREEQERKNKPPEKVKRSVADPATATLPTMDIEKPAAPTEKKQKKTVTQAPRQRDALDNLLDEQGVKPNNPSGGGTGGLDAVLASGDGKSGKKAGKKAKRGRN